MRDIQTTNDGSFVKISVIIPTYKPQSYLFECLNSICAQTIDKSLFEVILVLNGCKNPYERIIKEFISSHTEVEWVFIQLDKGGVSNARNMAIDIARGEYIAFIDDDDYVSPSYLGELYENASPDTVPLCYPLSFVDGTQIYEPYSITKDYNLCANRKQVPFYKAYRYFGGPVYKLLHRDIIGNRRFDVKYRNGEDSLFMFLISDKIKDVTFTSESAVYYRRIRQNSATTRKKSIKEVVWNSCQLSKEYMCIYYKGSGYRFVFLFKFLRGQIYTIIDYLFNNTMRHN